MTTEPQTEPLAELITKLQNSLTELQAQHQAELQAAKVAYDALKIEVTNQTRYKELWRDEAAAWRKLEGGTYDRFRQLTAAEVATKKVLETEYKTEVEKLKAEISELKIKLNKLV